MRVWKPRYKQCYTSGIIAELLQELQSEQEEDCGRMEADEHVIEKLHLAQDLTDFAEIYEGKVDLERKRYRCSSHAIILCKRKDSEHRYTELFCMLKVARCDCVRADGVFQWFGFPSRS